MILLEFFLLVSLSARLVSSNPVLVCQPSNDCHLSNGTLRCTNLNSSHSLFIKHCPNLQIKSLDLSGNNISRVVETADQMETPSTEIRDGEEWHEVKINTQFLATLERIDLSHNQLQSFPSELANSPALKELNLSFNKMNKMNNTPEMDALTLLNLQNNEFENLEDGSFENYPNLKELDLSGNKLKTLKNLKLKDVKVLNMSNNLIDKIEPNAFKDSPKLEILDLSKNLQTQIDKSIFEGIQMSLRQLDLSNNKLAKVFSDAFSELEQLQRLSLSQNPSIKNIDHIIFPYHLKVLELNNNSLQELNECSFQHLKDIERLNLGGNPLSCNCHIYRIFKTFGSRLYTNQNSTCRNLTNNQNVDVPLESLNLDCSAHNCRSHSTDSESKPRLNVTIIVDDTLVKIRWRSSYVTDQFLLQINDSSNKQVLLKYIDYDREYEFESTTSFTSYNVCIAALNDHNEILQRVCYDIYINNKSIIIGISAGLIALIPCVILLICIVRKDKQYAMKLLLEATAEDKAPIVPISDEKAHTNGVNPGFEPEDPNCIPETIQPDTPSTSENLQNEKSQSPSTHL